MDPLHSLHVSEVCSFTKPILNIPLLWNNNQGHFNGILFFKNIFFLGLIWQNDTQLKANLTKNKNKIKKIQYTGGARVARVNHYEYEPNLKMYLHLYADPWTNSNASISRMSQMLLQIHPQNINVREKRHGAWISWKRLSSYTIFRLISCWAQWLVRGKLASGRKSIKDGWRYTAQQWPTGI